MPSCKFCSEAASLASIFRTNRCCSSISWGNAPTWSRLHFCPRNMETRKRSLPNFAIRSDHLPLPTLGLGIHALDAWTARSQIDAISHRQLEQAMQTLALLHAKSIQWDVRISKSIGIENRSNSLKQLHHEWTGRLVSTYIQRPQAELVEPFVRFARHWSQLSTDFLDHYEIEKPPRPGYREIFTAITSCFRKTSSAD